MILAKGDVGMTLGGECFEVIAVANCGNLAIVKVNNLHQWYACTKTGERQSPHAKPGDTLDFGTIRKES